MFHTDVFLLFLGEEREDRTVAAVVPEVPRHIHFQGAVRRSEQGVVEVRAVAPDHGFIQRWHPHGQLEQRDTEGELALERSSTGSFGLLVPPLQRTPLCPQPSRFARFRVDGGVELLDDFLVGVKLHSPNREDGVPRAGA